MKHLKIYEQFDDLSEDEIFGKNHVFRIGEKVVALNDSPSSNNMRRIKDEIYKVQDILFCEKCGQQYLNFGDVANRRWNDDMGTCVCGFKTHARGLLWSNAGNYKSLTE
jgi:hypothetical protein